MRSGHDLEDHLGNGARQENRLTKVQSNVGNNDDSNNNDIRRFSTITPTRSNPPLSLEAIQI